MTSPPNHPKSWNYFRTIILERDVPSKIILLNRVDTFFTSNRLFPAIGKGFPRLSLVTWCLTKQTAGLSNSAFGLHFQGTCQISTRLMTFLNGGAMCKEPVHVSNLRFQRKAWNRTREMSVSAHRAPQYPCIYLMIYHESSTDSYRHVRLSIIFVETPPLHQSQHSLHFWSIRSWREELVYPRLSYPISKPKWGECGTHEQCCDPFMEITTLLILDLQLSAACQSLAYSCLEANVQWNPPLSLAEPYSKKNLKWASLAIPKMGYLIE